MAPADGTSRSAWPRTAGRSRWVRAVAKATRPVRRQVRRQVERFRRGGRPALLWALRLTAAAVAAYLAALVAFPGQKPLLAPLTALLVVQATPKSLLASGVDRVISVVAGVSLAVGFSAVVPLTWWSLGLVIGVSIMIGQVLRLKANLIEVPISGMLVLGVRAANTGDAAWHRITETLIGAGVGVLATLLLPPKVATGSAAEAIQRYAQELADLLVRAADEVAEAQERGDRIGDRARDWLDDVRSITRDVPNVGAALLHAEEGRQLNVRAFRSPDAAPGLRQGLEALEHSGVALRAMFRSVADTTNDPEWPEDESGDAAAADLEQVLRELGAGVAAFGELVRAEALSRELSAPERVHGVAEALQGLHDARDRLRERVLVRTDPALTELYVSLHTTVKRVLGEMDLEQRVRRQDMLRLQRRRTLGAGGLPELGPVKVAQWRHGKHTRSTRDDRGDR